MDAPGLLTVWTNAMQAGSNTLNTSLYLEKSQTGSNDKQPPYELKTSSYFNSKPFAYVTPLTVFP